MENKETQPKIAQLQVIQQNLQALLMQKQQFQMQFNEVESALSELKDAKQAYKIIANVMLLTQKETIEKDLHEKRNVLELRMKSIESQEERLRKKAEELQHDIVQEMKK